MTTTSKRSAISSRSRIAKAKPSSRLGDMLNNVENIVDDISSQLREMTK